jgi:DNA-formamidopyrimidine glycosylase
MPEGAEVKLYADCLWETFREQQIIDLEITERSRYWKGGLPNLEALSYPLQINNIASRGKKIIFDLEDADGKTIFFVSFLGLEGHWQYKKGKHSGILLRFGSFADEEKTILRTERTLYYDDSRHFGSFTICLEEKELDQIMKTVGPDLLEDEIDIEDYIAVCRKKAVANKPLCEFLMMQQHFSGVGNWVRAEVMYECGFHPFRLMESLDDEELELLLATSQSVLKRAYEAFGLTLATYVLPNGQKGLYETKVYGRKVDPDGNEVVQMKDKDKRTVHWVPEVQTKE